MIVSVDTSSRCSWCQAEVEASKAFVRKAKIKRHNWGEVKVIYFCAAYEADLWKKSLGKRFLGWA